MHICCSSSPESCHTHYSSRAQESVQRYVSALKQCRKTRNLEGGKRLHLAAVEAGLHTDKYVVAALISMYTKCGSMRQAREVFNSTACRDVVMWNSLLLGYVENGESRVALELFFKFMDCEPSSITYVAVIKACAGLATERGPDKQVYLNKGIVIHKQARDRMFESDIFVASALVDMYGKCGSMERAREVFDRMMHKNVVTWTSLLLGYVENGKSSNALELFTKMNCEPTHVTYVAVLKACAVLATEKGSEKELYLRRGIAIHEKIKGRGYDSNMVVASTLVDMYCKCGCMRFAREVFDRMVHKNVITWTCLILGYVENGESSRALDFFSKMDCEPTRVTYVAALKACAGLAMEESEKQFGLEKGIAIHGQITTLALESDIAVASTLVDMYGKCGCMQLAREMFYRMKQKNAVTWTCLLLGYVENGESATALELFNKIDCRPDVLTYVAALKACGCLGTEKGSNRQFCLEKVIAIHEQLKDSGLGGDMVVASTLVDVYGKCGSMHRAREVFEAMVHKDVVTWTALLLGYVENEKSSVALGLFTKMDCEPTHVTYVAVLKACAGLATMGQLEKQFYLQNGIAIHDQVKERGFDLNISVATTLVDMYGKCGSMHHAQEVFDRMVHRNAVTWSCLLLGYVENGENSLALDLFTKMDCEPTCVTYVAVLKACASLATHNGCEKEFYLEKGIVIHKQIKDHGFDSDVLVASALVDMYSKCGSMQRSREVFNAMLHRDVVMWNCLLLGYVENSESSLALDLFIEMDCEANSMTYVAVLKACACLTALRAGERIHAIVCKLGLDEEQVIVNTLIDFYGKCGSKYMAEELFNRMPSADIVSWNALMAGYTSLGETSQVFNLVKNILEAGLDMNVITFTCLLTACSRGGLVEEGRKYFEWMLKYEIVPCVEHYNCMVDMLGRANRLEEALHIVNGMGSKANYVTWRTLLGACKKWKNVEVGKAAFDALVAEDVNGGSAYILMRDIYGTLEHEGMDSIQSP